MRRQSIARCALMAGVLFGGARAVTGQTTVALNYDPVVHELTETTALGGHGDVARFFGPIAAIGELGVNHFDQATVLTVAPGIRYRIGSTGAARIQPSVQGLVGLWHCAACEVNQLFIQPG